MQQAILGELVLVATMGATIYFMPFLDFWDNVISIASMAGLVHLHVLKLNPDCNEVLASLLTSCKALSPPHACCAVLWLVLLTGEMMKWAHFGTLTDNAIAAAHVAADQRRGWSCLLGRGVPTVKKSHQGL